MPVLGGAVDTIDVGVVAIVERSRSCEPDAPPVSCSGTLVAPRAVLTAAHCLNGNAANGLEVHFDTATIPVVAGRSHPMFDDVTHANDVAVLILASDAPVAPIPMMDVALPEITGADVTIIGFGVDRLGTRTSGNARIETIAEDDLRLIPGPAMSCRGDSGGPVMLQGKVIGVTSFGDPACTQFGVAMRVDRQLAFVNQVIAEGAAQTRAFDPGEPLCNAACTTDAECPIETQCFAGACSYRGLPAAEFGAPCTANAGDHACIAMPDGTCRFLEPCDGEPMDDPGCCQGSPVTAWPTILVVLGLRRRKSR